MSPAGGADGAASRISKVDQNLLSYVREKLTD